MDFKLKPRLFSFFGVSAKLKDTYKDVSGKGINERYQECVAEDYDENVADLIDNALDNVVVPKTMKAVLIPVMEYMLGNIVFISTSVDIRRKLIQFAHRLYNVKGTYKGFELPLRLLGFTTITITDLTGTGTFDGGTFDDPDRTFDSERGGCCARYKLFVEGPVIMTDALLEAVNNICIFNQPINATLDSIEINATGGGIGSMMIESTFIVG